MKDFLINAFQITSEEAEVFSSYFHVKEYSKGDKFIECGKVCDKVGYVEKGLLKCVLIGENKEVIDDFVFENQFISNYYSFLTNKESSKEIICLEESVIRVISREKIQELSSEYRFIEQIAKKVTENLFILTHQKLEALRLQNAEERYLNLLSSNSKVLERVPQYDIASYLNVSPETVSRIRKHLSIRS